MREPEYLGHIGADAETEQPARHLFSLPLSDPSEFPDRLILRSECFVLFVAWDAASATNDEVTTFARKALRGGCAYVCVWGEDCERVHDIFDELRPGNDDDDLVMTTWHASESLDDALWYALFVASPPEDEALAAKTNSFLACSIANTRYAQQIAADLSDPQALMRRVEGKKTD